MQRERFIETHGVRLHAVEAGPGDGPLVVLLHGFPELWYGWRKQIQPLAEAGYRVLAPDQRGYNTSDKPAGTRAYALDELAADVIGLIDEAGRAKATIVGHDFGAAVAWWTAIRFPDRVERLGILNVPHPDVMRRHARRIWGVRDRFLELEMAESSLGLCDRGTLARIDEATHWVQHEEPQRVNGLLLELMSGAFD